MDTVTEGKDGDEKAEEETERCCYNPRKAWSHQKPEEATMDPPLEASEGANALILDFWLLQLQENIFPLF